MKYGTFYVPLFKNTRRIIEYRSWRRQYNAAYLHIWFHEIKKKTVWLISIVLFWNPIKSMIRRKKRVRLWTAAYGHWHEI